MPVVKRTNIKRRKIRVRSKIVGTKDIPRLSVRRTNRRMIAQLIDDSRAVTLAYCTDFDLDKAGQKLSKGERAFLVGKLIGEKAKGLNVKQAAFDRNGCLFHGRMARLAEGALQSGLVV